MANDYTDENPNELPIDSTVEEINVEELTVLEYREAVRNAELFLETYGSITASKVPSDYGEVNTMEPNETKLYYRLEDFI